MQDLKITLIQSEIHWEDIEANLAMFEEKIWQISGTATDVIILPEMFTTGFTNPTSKLAEHILHLWEEMVPKFVKVIPKDYKRVLKALERVTSMGLSGDEAVMAAFEENARDVSRVGGN